MKELQGQGFPYGSFDRVSVNILKIVIFPAMAPAGPQSQVKEEENSRRRGSGDRVSYTIPQTRVSVNI